MVRALRVRCACVSRRLQSSLYMVKGICILDNDGKRLLAKVSVALD